jgi:ribonuclease HII
MQEKKEEDLQQALNKISEVGIDEVGIDEVGKGAIFGPVFSAVVVLTEKNKFTLKNLE